MSVDDIFFHDSSEYPASKENPRSIQLFSSGQAFRRLSLLLGNINSQETSHSEENVKILH